MEDTVQQVRKHGFAFVSGAEAESILRAADWHAFVESYDRLEPDRYLARKFMRRRRRHAHYEVVGGVCRRKADGPHYQSPEYNPLQGGIERHFEPIEEAIGDGASIRRMIEFGASFFGSVQGANSSSDAPQGGFDVEAHQFRIESIAGDVGLPTPEGRHRDGVDFVLVAMVRRENLVHGTTTIHDASGRQLGSFTLQRPFDLALVHDRRVWHGVTAVEAIAANVPAYRDVLVITYRAQVQSSERSPTTKT